MFDIAAVSSTEARDVHAPPSPTDKDKQMSRSKPNDPFALFVQEWRQWTSLVEKYARHKKSRHRVSEEQYHMQHAALMEACHRFEQADNEPRRVFAGKVRQIVKPWVSLDAFKNETSHSLFALLARCAEVERTMIAKKSPINPAGWSPGMLASAVLVAFLGLGLLWLWWQPTVLEAANSHWRGAYIKISNTVRWSSFIERFSVITVIAVLIGIRLAMRTARTG